MTPVFEPKSILNKQSFLLQVWWTFSFRILGRQSTQEQLGNLLR
jgi:hypothetical protein